MSRTGSKPIEIPSGVTVTVQGGVVAAKGSQGELTVDLKDGIEAAVEGSTLTVTRRDDSRDCKQMQGLVRSLINNMVEGVSKGFTRELEIQGVGFKAAVQGTTLSLSLGFASPKAYAIPDTVKIEVRDNVMITVSGADKQQVGEAAARIRSFYPAEPYKGKGIRYKGEQVRRKVGKTVA
jgi:large subunit ribosomal protein L6